MWIHDPGSEGWHPERLPTCSARPAIEREHLMHEFEWQKYFMKRTVYTKIDRYEKLEFANGSNLAVDGNDFLHAIGSGKRRIDRLGK
jgi:hypothetical protein